MMLLLRLLLGTEAAVITPDIADFSLSFLFSLLFNMKLEAASPFAT